MNSQTTRIGWIEEIATKSNCSIEEVKTVINKYEIQQSPNIGIPKHLQIKELKFSGTKEGKYTDDFNFQFENLTSGIFGVISDNNLRGKTSVLEVIKWLLRGSTSSLQDGVKHWIKNASLKFDIESECYLVELNHSQNQVKGKLLNISDTNNKEISVFYSDDEFESCMSEFMIQQFSLDKISAFRNSGVEEEVGKKVNHSWSSLASALFISTNYGSLFGETTVDGLNNRLMNMYLGLPWVSTYTALKTIESQIKSENKVENIHINKELERKKKRLQEIQLELVEKEKLIKTFPNDNDTREKLIIARENYGNSSRELTSLDKILRKLTEEFDTIKETKINDKKRISNFKEDMAANAIFKRLNPTCCPHCDTKIDKEKIEKEKTSHHCAICDSALLDSEDSEILLDELELNLKSSEQAYKEIKTEYNKQNSKHLQISSNLLLFQKQIDQYEVELKTFSKRNEVEKEITRLHILKDEYSILEERPLEIVNEDKPIDEKKIILKAIEVTKGRFDELQKQLLEEVSKEILRISKLVGLGNYESIQLSSIPTLSIGKDGSTTSYSKVSPGEKLRLKVITTIALLSIAEKRKVGRHPGLLLIDSPSAQEVSDKDLNSLIEGLKNLTIELPFLQIIIASRATDVILNHIDEKHRKHAIGEDYLW